MPLFHRQVRNVKDQQGAGQIPVCLVGNKSDRVTEREVTVAEDIDAATELDCDFAETSAKNNSNIQKVFYGIVRKLQIIRLQMAESAKTSTHGGHGGISSVLWLFRRQHFSLDLNR